MSNIPKRGLGYCHCPINLDHKISYQYAIGLHRKAILEAIDDHLINDCTDMRQTVEEDFGK